MSWDGGWITLAVWLTLIVIACAVLMRSGRKLPEDPTPTCRPRVGVMPPRPWPHQTLTDRYLECAVQALQRPLATQAQAEDAVRSAEFFIEKAKIAMKEKPNEN